MSVIATSLLTFFLQDLAYIFTSSPLTPEYRKRTWFFTHWSTLNRETNGYIWQKP